ncbi:MAG: c(7)-type cytochrome triheme domain-containing protein, partial [Nitrospinota bacterium]
TPNAEAEESRKSDSDSDPKKTIYLDSSGKMAGTGNIKDGLAGNTFKSGEKVKALSNKEIPKDKLGLADWVKLVDKGFINPSPDLDPSVKDEPMDLNILLITAGKMEDVVYPHKVHTWWLNCESCHDELFTMETGATDMNMSGIIKGQWCGKCHGKVAFPLEDCARCHVKPKSGEKKARVIE